MRQYEYIEEAVVNTADIIELMDKLGKRGWRVVGLLRNRFIEEIIIYFMREIP